MIVIYLNKSQFWQITSAISLNGTNYITYWLLAKMQSYFVEINRVNVIILFRITSNCIFQDPNFASRTYNFKRKQSPIQRRRMIQSIFCWRIWKMIWCVYYLLITFWTALFRILSTLLFLLTIHHIHIVHHRLKNTRTALLKE